MLHKLIGDMIGAFADRNYIEHALKVYGYARAIGGEENLSGRELDTLCAAAVLHDIGIPAAIAAHGSEAGPYQEATGAKIAPPMLKSAGYDEETVQRATFLIAHHHSPEYGANDFLLQILLEADALVNLSRANPEQIARSREELFVTATGKRYLDAVYPPEN